jgi:[ribosomal protein S5]-alanine N-acetyltransferase
MIFLETERMLFRSHEPGDEPEFVKMHADPEVRRYVGNRPWPEEEAIRRFRNGYLGRPNETYGLWATFLKEQRKYIGACGLALPPNRAVPGLGYYIARHYWGRGLVSEAPAAFLEIGFRRLELPRILADVEKGHGASEHILQKFGFQLVSQEEFPTTERIICLYELLRKDWESRQSRRPPS